ncbi:MAG: DUF2784 domain-containing protein [Deltaproteobacteria bacterium]|nr:DUF2784 domain-containing protein [Deltaproteobacteria bacterium]
MLFGIAADMIVLLHLAFILFVVLGGGLVLKWRRLAWIHLPCVFWGAFIEFTGGICPLTPLENRLRRETGGGGYAGDFIGHYLLPLIYPDQLTAAIQTALGLAVLVLNGLVYGLLFIRGNPEKAKTE